MVLQPLIPPFGQAIPYDVCKRSSGRPAFFPTGMALFSAEVRRSGVLLPLGKGGR